MFEPSDLISTAKKLLNYIVVELKDVDKPRNEGMIIDLLIKL